MIECLFMQDAQNLKEVSSFEVVGSFLKVTSSDDQHLYQCTHAQFEKKIASCQIDSIT